MKGIHHLPKPSEDACLVIPYGRQCIDESDIQAVLAVLESDYLTTGPKVDAFEDAVSDYTGAGASVAFSSGTAALHAAMHAIGIGPGDEVILPSMTFVATANAVVYQGGTPVFADVDAETLLLDPDQVVRNITPRTKAVMAVDYAGHPCAYDALRKICTRHGLFLVADACHALGAAYRQVKVGTLADLTVFSFHPVKHITTGEGGMACTNDRGLAHRMKVFRNHGITTDHRSRALNGTWSYEMVDLGYNYRMTDIQCALGLSQLKKLPGFLSRRRQIAGRYDTAFSQFEEMTRLATCPQVSHAYHLYVVRFDLKGLGSDRAAIFGMLREKGIGVNVHYMPVHLQPFYIRQYGTGPGQCPMAETAYEEILSLPIFPGMTDSQVEKVTQAVGDTIHSLKRSRAR